MRMCVTCIQVMTGDVIICSFSRKLLIHLWLRYRLLYVCVVILILKLTHKIGIINLNHNFRKTKESLRPFLFYFLLKCISKFWCFWSVSLHFGMLQIQTAGQVCISCHVVMFINSLNCYTSYYTWRGFCLL